MPPMFSRRTLVLLATPCLALSLFLSSCRSHRAPETSTPALALLYNVEEEPTEKSAIAQILQTELGKHGIPVTLQPVANSVFYQRVGAGQFQAALALWYLDYPDAEGFLTDFYSKAGFRMSGYQRADYDKAYLTGLLAPAAEGKTQGFANADGILMQDLPWIPLYSNNELFLLGAGTQGFRSNAYQYYDYRRVDRASLRVASNVELQTLDPAQVYDLASKHVATQSYEGLVTMGSDLKIAPALADSWQFSPVGDRITFRIRSGVRFHGNFGTVTAADVAASFERVLRSNSPYAYIFDHVVGVDDFRTGKSQHVTGFESNGPSTFIIRLKEPFPTMLTWLLAPAAAVIPARVPAKYDFSKGSVGTGPFILKSWDGTVGQFEANSTYWAKAEDGNTLPKPRSLSIRIMKDVNAMLTAFQQGDLDILNVPLALYNEVLGPDGQVKAKYSEKYQLREVPLNNLKFVAFRMAQSPWGTDQDLRRRVNTSIDRSVIVKELFRGHARPQDNIVPAELRNW